ncbi:hypothetical protein WI57_09320 [Burkholderia cepacia]|nr:hypothetical protein WI57_09320 [Burkholderia cepacia]
MQRGVVSMLSTRRFGQVGALALQTRFGAGAECSRYCRRIRRLVMDILGRRLVIFVHQRSMVQASPHCANCRTSLRL